VRGSQAAAEEVVQAQVGRATREPQEVGWVGSVVARVAVVEAAATAAAAVIAVAAASTWPPRKVPRGV
jgi:hypothetical protein